MKTAASLGCLCLTVVLVACDRVSEPLHTPEPSPREVSDQPIEKSLSAPVSPAIPISSTESETLPAKSQNLKILPLARILQIVRRDTPGEVLEVEEDDDDDLLTYEVQILTPDDRKIEITLNAYTGAIIERDED